MPPGRSRACKQPSMSLRPWAAASRCAPTSWNGCRSGCSTNWAERGLPPAEIRLPHWHILHYKRTGQKTRAMEQRDEERAARADVARLEAECLQLERELDAARANDSVQEIASTAPPQVARALP